MKILYINPGRIEAGLDYVIKGPPLALLAIAAMVPEHEATLFDFKVDKYKESKFRKLIRDHDVVAITSMTPQIDHALEVATMVKEEGLTTIIGGYHPTLEPESVTSHPAIDFCVRGEGEHTFRAVIDFIDNNKQNVKISEIPGISYRNQQGNVVHNTNRELEPNLDNFPIPRRDLLRGKKYQYLGSRVALMETSRGCPHRCTFCCIIKMWSDPKKHMVYRKKSLKRVMQEVYSIYNLKGQTWDFIFFNDDNFTVDVKRTDRILDALLKSGINRKLSFACQSRVDTLHRNPWLAEKMYRAGFRQIFLGIESVHQQSLDKMGKHTNAQMIRSTCQMLTTNGIAIFGGMIIGYPGETFQMVRENIDFAISLDLDFVQFTPITAFPGTDFFKEMKAKGKIETFDWKFYNLFNSMMHTDELSQNQMNQLVGEAYSKYYLTIDYLKKMLGRTVLHKKFNWYKRYAFRWLNQFARGGWAMLKSQGITVEMAKSDKKFMQRNQKYQRYNRKELQTRFQCFKHLLRRGKYKKIDLESMKLLPYATA